MLLFLFLVAWATQVSGQTDLTVAGRIKVENGSLKDTKILIEKDGQRVKTMEADARFEFQLDFQAVYIISFVKEGYVTKKLRFDTHVPDERIEYGFLPFEFVVSIFKQYDGVNTVIFNQPVGMIAYSETIDEFDYDTDYTKSIQAQIEEIQEEIEEKIAEEAEQIEVERKAEEKRAKEVSSLSSSGSKNLSSGKYKEAIDDYEKALKLKPDDPELIAKIKEAKKGLEQAQAKLESEKRVQDLLTQATVEQDKKNYPEAKKLLEDALKLAPENKDVTKKLASVQDQIQAQQQQEQRFDQLVDQAKAASQNKNYDEAQKLIEEALAIKPNSPVAGDVQSQIREAVGVMEEEKRQKEQQQEAFDNQVAEADELFDDGKFEEAKKAYQNALGLMDDSDVRNKVAQVDQAIADKEKQEALEAEKKTQFDQLLTEANALIKSNDLAGAEQKLTQAAGIFPENEQLKSAQQELADKKDALAAEAEKAAQQQKEFDELIAKGNDELGKGDLDKAEVAFKNAKNLIGDNPKAEEGLKAVTKAREMQAEIAQKEAQQQQQFDGLLSEANDLIASGDLPTAEQKLIEASAIFPDNDGVKDAQKRLDDKKKELAQQAEAEQERLQELEKLISGANDQLNQGNIDKAEEGFKEADALISDDPRVVAGLAAVAKARQEEAAQAQAEEEKKAEFESLLQQAETAFSNGSLDDAKEFYTQALGVMEDDRASKGLEKTQAAIDEKLAAASEQQEKRNQFNQLMMDGESALGESNFDRAEDLFTQAVGLFDEEAPKQKLEEVDAKRAELAKANQAAIAEQEAAAAAAKKKEQYDELIAKADDAFGKEDYDVAKEDYQQATSLFPEESYPQDRLTEIESRQSALSANAAAAAAQAAKDKQYNELIAAGDKAFAKDDFDGAETSYQEALAVKDESYPKDQLAAIAKQREVLASESANAAAAAAQAAKDEQYNELIAAGDKAFGKEDFDGAETSYQEALAVKDESYPKDQLAAIAKQREALASESANAAAAAAQAAKDKQYNELIAAGDKAFGKEDFDGAETSYQEALAVKDESYPKDQLAAIAKQREALASESANAAAAAAQAAKDEQYNKLIAAGDKAFGKEDYDGAETSYQEALSVKDESYPKDQLAAIAKQREALASESANAAAAAAQAVKDKQYNELIVAGDKAFGKADYDGAETSYQEALSVKDESYPKDQLAAIAKQREALASESANAAAAAAQAVKDKQYNELIAAGDKAFGKDDYDGAAKSYNGALAIKDESYPKEQLNEIEKRKAAAAELAAVKAQEQSLAQKEDSYATALEKADASFEKEEWSKAIAGYNDALAIKEATYPKDQIVKAEEQLNQLALLAAEQESRKKFEQYMDEGSAFFQANKLEAARDKYVKAQSLYDEEAPRTRIEKIDQILASREKQRSAEAAKALAAERLGGEASELTDIIESESKPSSSNASPTVGTANSSKQAASGVVISDPKPTKSAAAVSGSDENFEAKVYDGIQNRVAEQQAKGQEAEQRNELAKKYPQRKTVEQEKVGNSLVTYVYINDNGFVTTYKKVEHNWGGVYFFVDERPTSQRFWEHQTE